MYAIPTPGRSVPIPGTRTLLPATGQNIGQVTQYWQRRLREGDIALSETPPAVAAASEAAKSAPAAASTAAPAAAATTAPAASATNAPPPAPTPDAATAARSAT